MSQSKSRAVLAVVLFCATLTLVGFTEQSPSAVVEQGKFTLHKFEQPIGEETYEIRREGDSLNAKIDFKFTDRGTEVPLATTFRAGYVAGTDHAPSEPCATRPTRPGCAPSNGRPRRIPAARSLSSSAAGTAGAFGAGASCGTPSRSDSRKRAG